MKPKSNIAAAKPAQIKDSPAVVQERLVRVLPCPFCGKKPEVFPSGDRTDGAEMIECMTDGCVNPHVSYYGHNVARKKWNTRSAMAGSGEGSDVKLSDVCGILCDPNAPAMAPATLEPGFKKDVMAG